MGVEPVANPHRGEVVAVLAGRPMLLRPTWEAMARIEAALGSGLVDVMARFGGNKLTLRETSVILREGLVAAGERPEPTLDQVMEAAFATGVMGLIEPVSALLANMLSGGRDPDVGNVEAAAGSGATASPTAAT